MIANLLSDRFGHRVAGIVLLSIAAIALTIAVTMGWSSIQRWRAAATMAEWRDIVLAGDRGGARQVALEAASYKPRAAAPGLATIDPGTAAGAQNLEILSLRCEPRWRGEVETAIAFSQALRKQAAQAPEPIDSEYAHAIAALEQDQAANWPTAVGQPTAALARAAAQRFARAAWNGGDAEAIRQSLGRFVLLCPRHAQVPRARMVLAAIDPTTAPERLAAIVGGSSTPPEASAALLRACLHLAPDRAAAIARAIPVNLRRPEDERALMLQSDVPIADLAARAAQAEPPVAEQIAWRCVDAGRLDLAERAAARAPDAARREIATAIATARGDVAALAKLDPGRADLRARISEPRPVEGKIAFHLATPSGLVPTEAPVVMYGDRPLPSEMIKRWDSLIALPRPEIPVAAEIRVGGTAVWSGRMMP